MLGGFSRLAAAGLAALSLTVGTSTAATPGKFKNCTAMHKRYPHGVGKFGARDHTSGDPVTNFRRSPTLYRLNSGLDRDGDGIACEAH